MIIKCVCNSGKEIRAYELRELRHEEIGRFGSSESLIYDLEIGSKFLVMGQIISQGALFYLVDENGCIGSYPYPLFEVIDDRIPPFWHFATLNYKNDYFPYQEARWGYKELVYENEHRAKLADFDEDAIRIYFRRKIELEEYYKSLDSE